MPRDTCRRGTQVLATPPRSRPSRDDRWASGASPAGPVMSHASLPGRARPVGGRETKPLRTKVARGVSGKTVQAVRRAEVEHHPLVPEARTRPRGVDHHGADRVKMEVHGTCTSGGATGWRLEEPLDCRQGFLHRAPSGRYRLVEPMEVSPPGPVPGGPRCAPTRARHPRRARGRPARSESAVRLRAP